MAAHRDHDRLGERGTMEKREKAKIYLAGPMTGCNALQLHQWRNEVKKKYDKEFSFSDPTTRWFGDPLGKSKVPSEIVEADLQYIEDADGMLVNMWRESIGAAIGMVHAHRVGTPAVVADPNHLGSRMLAFYAVGLEDHPLKAMNVLRNVLRAESWHVLKTGGRAPEPFDRRKLVESIGKACGSAGKDDVVVPRIVLPEVMDRLKGRLKGRKMGDQITSSDINESVQDALEALSKNDVHNKSVEGILALWQKGNGTTKHDRKMRLADAGSQPAGNYDTASVKVYSPKSHSAIWGKSVRSVKDIPSKEARTFFETIMRTRGITEIVLEGFSSMQSRNSVCGAIKASPTPHVLEGKIFDKGKKGSMQRFQVRVQDEATKDRVLAQCEENLRSAGLWDERKRTEPDRPA